MKVRKLREKGKSIIIGNIEMTDNESELITLKPKKPTQLEPKLEEYRLDMEVLFLQTNMEP